MPADRSELHQLVDRLPDSEVASGAAELRRRVAGPVPAGTWPRRSSGIIDGDDASGGLADDLDEALTRLGVGRESS